MSLSHYTFCSIFTIINDLLWGVGSFLLVIFIGIYFTIRIKPQNIIHIVNHFRKAMGHDYVNFKSSKKGIVSHFQALSTALAASMGTGNIIGVATALSVGGPGAVFWMWVSGLLGTSIGFVENTLGYLYRENSKGPMGYIATAFKSQRASVVYAVLCVAASFGIGNITQSNAIAAAASEFEISPVLIGLATALLTALIIFKGARKVVAACEKIVPFIAVLYLLSAIIVVVFNGKYITNLLIHIIKSAFGFQQISGGISASLLKKSISIGLRRGIFSNEAGLGSTVLIHSEMDARSPVEMGILSVAEIIIDTILCCTATAFVVLLSGADLSTTNAFALVAEGFRPLMGNFSPTFVSIITVVFAFCTIIGWYFYGEKCLEFTIKTGNKKPVFCYRFLYASACFAGAVSQLQLVWEIADIVNWFMLVINLTAVVILHNKAIKAITEYTNSIN